MNTYHLAYVQGDDISRGSKLGITWRHADQFQVIGARL